MKNYKLNLDNFIIEVTRKCNLKCKHCLRGDAENIDFKKEDLIKFIEETNLKYINTLVITGGEPFLNLEGMKDILEILKEKEIEVSNFFIATNGTKFGLKELNIVADYYNFCIDNDISMVKISNSQYHQEERKNKPISNLLLNLDDISDFSLYLENHITNNDNEFIMNFIEENEEEILNELEQNAISINKIKNESNIEKRKEKLFELKNEFLFLNIYQQELNNYIDYNNKYNKFFNLLYQTQP